MMSDGQRIVVRSSLFIFFCSGEHRIYVSLTVLTFKEKKFKSKIDSLLSN